MGVCPCAGQVSGAATPEPPGLPRTACDPRHEAMGATRRQLVMSASRTVIRRRLGGPPVRGNRELGALDESLLEREAERRGRHLHRRSPSPSIGPPSPTANSGGTVIAEPARLLPGLSRLGGYDRVSNTARRGRGDPILGDHNPYLCRRHQLIGTILPKRGPLRSVAPWICDRGALSRRSVDELFDVSGDYLSRRRPVTPARQLGHQHPSRPRSRPSCPFQYPSR